MNPTEVNVVEGDQSVKGNEKKETKIELQQNFEDLSTNKDIEKQISDNKRNENADKMTVDLEKGIKSVAHDNQTIEQKRTALQYGAKDRKPPAIWIQYNQAYGQGQGYGQGYGSQGYGQNPQHNYGGGHYGGAPLDYDPQSRNLFVKFVFIILLVMLIITAAIALFILATPGVKEFYQRTGFLIMIASMIVLVGMNYVMACSACSRVPPCNFISLFVVVIAMSNLVGAVTVNYKTHILIFAVIATVITVAVCVLLACSNFDFTKWYLYVVAIAVAFITVCMMVSIAMLVMNVRYKPLQIVMLFVGALINVVILVMELQMILGGRAIEMGEDDYALAAYMLYSSIVDIFLKIVQMMGLMDE